MQYSTQSLLHKLITGVVVCLTWSTCCNVQPHKVYDALAVVAFDVARRVSEALVQELRLCRIEGDDVCAGQAIVTRQTVDKGLP